MAVRREDAILRQLEHEWGAAIASLPREELTQPAWLAAMGAPMPWRPAALFAELEDVRREWQELRDAPLSLKQFIVLFEVSKSLLQFSLNMLEGAFELFIWRYIV